MKKEVSCRKVTSLYQLGYLIDKKGHRKRKNIGRKNCCFKKYAYFCAVKMANKTNVFPIILHFFKLDLIHLFTAIKPSKRFLL